MRSVYQRKYLARHPQLTAFLLQLSLVTQVDAMELMDWVKPRMEKIREDFMQSDFPEDYVAVFIREQYVLATRGREIAQ